MKNPIQFNFWMIFFHSREIDLLIDPLWEIFELCTSLRSTWLRSAIFVSLSIKWCCNQLNAMERSKELSRTHLGGAIIGEKRSKKWMNRRLFLFGSHWFRCLSLVALICTIVVSKFNSFVWWTRGGIYRYPYRRSL